jgi:transcriptional regulator with XRE-family HTH domain
MIVEVNRIRPTLAFMAAHTPGQRLRQLREHLSLSYRAAAKRSETLSYSTIRALEERVGSWDRVEIGTLRALARAYEIPLDHLVRFVLMIEDAPDITQRALRTPEELEVHPDWIAFAVDDPMSPLSADALGAPAPKDGRVVYIPKDHLVRHGTLRENVRVFQVTDAFLVSDEVRRIERTFAVGDYLAVDTGRAPAPGDVVAAWYEGRQAIMLTRHLVDAGAIPLHGLGNARAVVYDDREDSAQFLGSVVWRGG